jgi:tetratricopeptide (TPR) repeat protein
MYSTPKPISEFDKNIKLAEGYLMWKKYDSAIMLLLPLIDEYPDEPIIYDKLANCYFLKDDFKKALYYIETAIDLNPENYLYYINISRIYSFISDFNKSIKFLEKAIDIYSIDKKIFPPVKMYSKNKHTKIVYLELKELFNELQQLIFLKNNIILKKPFEHQIYFENNYFHIFNEELQIEKIGDKKLSTYKAFCHAILGFYTNYVLGLNAEMDIIYKKIVKNIQEEKKENNIVMEYYKKNKSNIDKYKNIPLNASEDLDLFYETLPYRQQANLTLL